jgi:protein TonB
MFEDSTFESAGKIHTRSRNWMIVTFGLNGSILLALVMIPLVFPDALTRQPVPTLIVTPAAPTPEKPQEAQKPVQARADLTEMRDGRIFAPQQIPDRIRYVSGPEPQLDISAATFDPDPRGPGKGDDPFGKGRGIIVVHTPDNTGPVHLPSTLVAGNLIYKTLPIYPPIAKAAGVQGTVVLQAMISKVGAIENLHVVSGNAMLQQAAMDAVKRWRYRPYMLNQQPVEVDTTVNVVFSLER